MNLLKPKKSKKEVIILPLTCDLCHQEVYLLKPIIKPIKDEQQTLNVCEDCYMAEMYW